MSSLTRTLVILLGVAATACSRCSPPQEFEFYVEGVPHTVDDAEDMDDPPDVEVTVKKGQKAHSGNVACGHSAVCIIVLPFVVGEAIFPEHYRVVTVKKSGAVWYSGLYRGNGEFMHGVITEKGQARRIDLVNASYVGRKVVVETAHGPLGPDGKPGKLEDSSVQKQVDLLSEYEKVLALGWPADKRGRALAEALRILHHDAVPLAKKQLAEHPEYAFRAPVIRSVCKDETPALSAKADRDAVIDAVLASKPDAATALAAAECYRQDLGDPRAAKLLRIVLTELCAEPKEGTFNSFQAFALGDVDAKTLPPPGKDARHPAGHQYVYHLLRRHSRERPPRFGGDHPQRSSFLGRSEGVPGAGPHLRHLWPGPLHAFQQPRRHLPDGHDPPGRRRPQPDLRLRHPLPLAIGRSHRRRPRPV